MRGVCDEKKKGGSKEGDREGWFSQNDRQIAFLRITGDTWQKKKKCGQREKRGQQNTHG